MHASAAACPDEGVACMRCVMTCPGNISERVNEEPQSSRGRSKYSTYQSNFKAGRKSSSLMNLCGKRRLSKPPDKLDSRWCSRFTVASGALGFFLLLCSGAGGAFYVCQQQQPNNNNAAMCSTSTTPALTRCPTNSQ